MSSDGKNKSQESFSLSCPIPGIESEFILLAHGGGGRLTSELIDKLFMPTFGDSTLSERHDGAVIEIGDLRLAVTTDSFVVTPLFFPGGDIGKLAIFGTVNDLAMCGAKPLYLSAAFIIEEGLPSATVKNVAKSMAEAASISEIRIITGDTKVVERKTGNDLYINTTGIGVIEHQLDIRPKSILPGDKIILSGDIGRHGIAVMARREGFEFETSIESDCAPLWKPVKSLLEKDIEIHCLRDLTRGGLATALVEIAEAAGATIEIDETKISVSREVAGACEILGLDPHYVANEGRFVCFVPEKDAVATVSYLQQFSPNASVIGQVNSRAEKAGVKSMVTLRTAFGTFRMIDRLVGDQLPRIC